MDDLITVGQAADLRGVSVGAVHSWIQSGRLRLAGHVDSPLPRGPRRVAVYRRADVLAVETPGRGRKPRRAVLERRPEPPPGPYASEKEAIRAVRSCYPGLSAHVAAGALLASGGDVARACDSIWASRRFHSFRVA